MITFAEQKHGILKNELPQVIRSICRWVIAIGHVGLIAEIHELFPGKIKPPVGAGLHGVVIEKISMQQSFKHCEATYSRIEHANRILRHHRSVRSFVSLVIKGKRETTIRMITDVCVEQIQHASSRNVGRDPF